MVARNPVGWFEIPVTNMQRAVTFYESVFEFKMKKPDAEFSYEMMWFPNTGDMDGAGATGALAKHPSYKPSKDGVNIMFTAFSGDCAKELGRVAKAGGKVLHEKTLIKPDIGYFGIFLDSEGNRVSVHSRK